MKTEPVKKKKKGRRRRMNVGEEMNKKKRVKGQKLRLWVPPCMFNYKNVIES